jgi:hypothetical protein
MFCGMEVGTRAGARERRAPDLSSLRNVLSLKTLRCVCDGQLVFGKALILATQLHYQSSSSQWDWARVMKTHELTRTIEKS